jgi:hypothetical protein
VIGFSEKVMVLKMAAFLSMFASSEKTQQHFRKAVISWIADAQKKHGVVLRTLIF